MGHDTDETRLVELLEESRSLGFLGPGPIQPHVHNAQAFADQLNDSRRILDLGSGGGLPGLVLSRQLREDQYLVLLDAMERRCRFLERAVSTLGVGARVDVRRGRAEELARDPLLRGTFDTVVSRSFGRPAVTAECAVGFMSGVGARLLVSEPPESDATRWDREGLADLGLATTAVRRASGVTLVCLEAVRPVSHRYPRRSGIPDKRPLF